jgi:hypothetical protein
MMACSVVLVKSELVLILILILIYQQAVPTITPSAHALGMEVSEQWQSFKAYLSLDNNNG